MHGKLPNMLTRTRFFPWLAAAVAALLSGCAGANSKLDTSSPCYANEASYACQVQRYHDVAAD
jgi:hypothetical protein